jgi:hypothetical protein
MTTDIIDKTIDAYIKKHHLKLPLSHELNLSSKNSWLSRY